MVGKNFLLNINWKNLHFLNNYLIPFLDKEFLTKKGKDLNDLKIICKAIYDGAHRKEQKKGNERGILRSLAI